MSVLSYFYPVTVLRTSSPFNRDIRVVEEQGTYKLLVNGSRQSGEYIKSLWQHALTRFRIYPSPDVKTILVLGVGGGTVMHLLHGLYPEADITGVDIDGTMVEIGRKYFKLDGFRIHVGDARTFISSHKGWDLIVVDLFIGATIPSFVSGISFVKRIHDALTPRGMVLVNYLREFEYKTLSELFSNKLKRIFGDVDDVAIHNNRFFCVIK